jgi:hypothetical protein
MRRAGVRSSGSGTLSLSRSLAGYIIGIRESEFSEGTAFEQSSRDRKRIEMLFVHLKRILKLGRLANLGFGLFEA